jgi:hypothetical protein
LIHCTCLTPYPAVTNSAQHALTSTSHLFTPPMPPSVCVPLLT